MQELQALPPPLTIATAGVEMRLPTLIGTASEQAARDTLEFFTARINNKHTREAYGRAVWRFCQWCDGQGLPLHGVTAPAVASYLQTLEGELSAPSVKLHLSGIRHWMDWLTQRGSLPMNPASSVRGPKHVVHEGKTQIVERAEAKRLLASITGDDVVSLRDRAVIAVMLFGFVRVGAVVKLRVRDFENEGAEASLLLHEKGGKVRRIPAHHLVRQYVQDYLHAAGLEPRSKAPLFQSAPRRTPALTGKPLHRTNVWEMVKRRCHDARLPSTICNHSFRAAGITIHQENGGTLEDAAKLAGHASTRTTQLYSRKSRKLERAEVERVQL